jgi:hypothetical protein
MSRGQARAGGRWRVEANPARSRAMATTRTGTTIPSGLRGDKGEKLSAVDADARVDVHGAHVVRQRRAS